MRQRKKQFKLNKVKPNLYDRKVQRTGTSVVLSLTRLMPKDWLYVRIKPLEKTEEKLVLEITKLWSVEDDAQPIKNNKTGEQNT
jgi:hypothetical protein